MKIPEHLALIPDGNRRWAEQKNLPVWEGHRLGIELFKDFSEWCYELGVRHITAYALSTENFRKRNKKELSFLFEIYAQNLRDLIAHPKVKKWQVRVYFAGDRESLPANIKKLMSEIEEDTSKHKERTLTLCFNYSGREEILNACKKHAAGGEQCTHDSFEDALYVKRPVDLLIRTAESRISNFLLWQLAYAEIYFWPKFFPEFTKDDLLDAIKQYNKTERRFGK